MKIFVLEDDPDRIRWFTRRFANHEWDCIQTCAREYEFRPPYDLILLDHDLGGRFVGGGSEDSGLTFIRGIKNRIGTTTCVILHSYNPDGVKAMLAEWPESIPAPFRSKEFDNILNAILPLQHREPAGVQ